MKKSIFILFFLVIKISAGYSQTKAVVIDSTTSKTVPYVNIWVENENNGTTSNDYGEFIINETDSTKNIVFSAIGYKRETVQISQIKNIINLKPETTVLEEVVLTKKKESKKIVIDKFKKSKIHFYYGSGKTPWMVGKYFPNEDKYLDTPFIKEFAFLTNSEIENAKFNIRLYEYDSLNFIGNSVYDKNIISSVKKGKKTTIIDISDLNIRFPKKGLIVVVEWLIIESNKREYSYISKGIKKKNTAFEPMFGAVAKDTNKYAMVYRGKWMKTFKNTNQSIKNYKDKYSELAVSLTLTN